MRLTYVEALALAMRDALAADPRVLVIGSGFGGLSPVAQRAFAPLLRDCADRLLVTPIAELALAGSAVGAALAGARPLVDLSTGSFLLQALPQILNEAANIHYMTGGQSRVPATFYSVVGLRGGGAAQHSHRPAAWLASTPGLQILLPATPEDAYGLCRYALLESQNPSALQVHALLFEDEGEFDPQRPGLPVGRAAVRREGRDLTVVASSVMVPRALQAAEQVQADGICAEVVDLRTLAPLDRPTVLASVAKTGRTLIADEGTKSFGPAAEIAALLAEDGFPLLRAPVRRVATPDVPIPYSPPLEAEITVTAERIAQAMREMMGPGAAADGQTKR